VGALDIRQQPAPITPWNPQPDLFLEPPPVPPVRGGALWQAQWQAQQRRLARHARLPQWQQVARESDAQRPGPEILPACVDYDWQWPAFARLTVSEAAAWAPLFPSERRGLPAGVPRDALAHLLLDVAQPIAWALSQPCPVIETATQVRVEFLGCIAWVANRAQRRLQLELRDQAGEWQAATSGFDLEHALANGQWLTQALLPWLPRIERDFGNAAGAVYAWLLRRLARQFDTPYGLAATERQVRSCLQLDPELARALQRIRRYAPPRMATSFLYTQLWRREDFWTGLERRMPTLVLFCYLTLRTGTEAPGGATLAADADLGALRAHCRRWGLGPAGWRFLCRFGSWSYEGLLLHHEPEDGAPHVGHLAAWVQWQAAAGLRQPLPPGYTDSIDEAFAIGWPDGAPHPLVGLDPRLGRILEAHAPGPAGQGRPPIPSGEFRMVLKWLVRAEPELDRNQWQAGWPALRRAARQWRLRTMEERWACKVEAFTAGVWRLRPLTNVRELAEEGKRMRHCVADFAEPCQAGAYRVFTVEHAASGAPQATVSLRHKNGAWEIAQVLGPRNAAAGPQMLEIAQDLLTRYRL
jgi:hypothetical protein